MFAHTREPSFSDSDASICRGVRLIDMGGRLDNVLQKQKITTRTETGSGDVLRAYRGPSLFSSFAAQFGFRPFDHLKFTAPNVGTPPTHLIFFVLAVLAM